MFLTRATIYQDFLLWHLHSSCPGASVPWQHNTCPLPGFWTPSPRSAIQPLLTRSQLGGSFPFQKAKSGSRAPLYWEQSCRLLGYLVPISPSFSQQLEGLGAYPPLLFVKPPWLGRLGTRNKFFRGCWVLVQPPSQHKRKLQHDAQWTKKVLMIYNGAERQVVKEVRQQETFTTTHPGYLPKDNAGEVSGSAATVLCPSR